MTLLKGLEYFMVNKMKIKGTNWENQFVSILLNNIGESSVKRIAGSGAIGTSISEPLLQGDVIANFLGFSKKFRVEAKVGYGGDTQLTVKKEWFDKIKMEAENSNCYPMIACKFSGAKRKNGVQYFIALDMETFCDIINYVDDLKKELDSVMNGQK